MNLKGSQTLVVSKASTVWGQTVPINLVLLESLRRKFWRLLSICVMRKSLEMYWWTSKVTKIHEIDFFNKCYSLPLATTLTLRLGGSTLMMEVNAIFYRLLWSYNWRDLTCETRVPQNSPYIANEIPTKRSLITIIHIEIKLKNYLSLSIFKMDMKYSF